MIRLPFFSMLEGCSDKLPKQRMRIHGARFEFGVKLTPEKPGMIFELDDFHKIPIGGNAAEYQSTLLKRFTIGIIEFVAVAVSFGNLFFFVSAALPLFTRTIL